MAEKYAWVTPDDQPATSENTLRARRVLVVDDHPIVREGLRQLLANEDDLQICAKAETARQARFAITAYNPDLVTVEISLARGDGIELLRNVRAHHPRLRVLVLSTHDEGIYAERLLALGAHGYVMKDAPPDELLLAFRRVLDGDIYMSGTIRAKMVEKFTTGESRLSTDPVDALSQRELQVLHMIGKGMSTSDMARSLYVSVKTIESHRQRIKRKLDLRTGPMLVRYAIKWFTGRDGRVDDRAKPLRAELFPPKQNDSSRRTACS
jgi:DNA-binding NarL/FixJ family response regulator